MDAWVILERILPNWQSSSGLSGPQKRAWTFTDEFSQFSWNRCWCVIVFASLSVRSFVHVYAYENPIIRSHIDILLSPREHSQIRRFLMSLMCWQPSVVSIKKRTSESNRYMQSVTKPVQNSMWAIFECVRILPRINFLFYLTSHENYSPKNHRTSISRFVFMFSLDGASYTITPRGIVPCICDLPDLLRIVRLANSVLCFPTLVTTNVARIEWTKLRARMFHGTQPIQNHWKFWFVQGIKWRPVWNYCVSPESGKWDGLDQDRLWISRMLVQILQPVAAQQQTKRSIQQNVYN